MARRTLDAPHVKPFMDADGVIEPDWDARAVPLEERKFGALHSTEIVAYDEN